MGTAVRAANRLRRNSLARQGRHRRGNSKCGAARESSKSSTSAVRNKIVPKTPDGKIYVGGYLLSVDKRERLEPLPGILNLPVHFLGLPYAVFSPAHNDWSPHGITPMDWWAISTPIVGTLFWWMAGRTIEAWLSLRAGAIQPKLRWPELFVGAAEVLSSALVIVAAVVEGHKDRPLEVAVLTGGLIWLGLGFAGSVVWILQFHLRRKISSVT